MEQDGEGIPMSGVVVIGTQWGDEGKGKVVDFYAAESEMIVRFNGGNNAGHTIVVGGETVKLHLLPSGVMHPGKHVVIGNGVVVDPDVLLAEIKELEARGHGLGRLSISDRAHLIMPYHRTMDAIEERLKGDLAAGTTRRGIGPCYQDKAARFGLRAGDLLDLEELARRLGVLVPMKQKVIAALGAPDDPRPHITELFALCEGWAARLGPQIEDTAVLINDALERGANVLFEGAQGVHLDIDHGIYPFGTSSNTITGAACTGAGVPPQALDEVVGVVKAYISRVGAGPVPTEQGGKVGEHLREVGKEYGTTTGRPRRCGWLDLCLVRYSHMLCGLTSIALTKLDILSNLDAVKVCVSYKARGRTIKHPPADMRLFAECEPQYVELEGWKDPGRDAWRRAVKEGLAAMPHEAREYIAIVEEEIGVPVSFVGVGPGREETLDLRG
jgi:adenylosuccinate synthase